MKKVRLFLLSLIILASSLPFFVKTDAFAEQNASDKVQTGIFLPTSYLQYYKLDNPFALCRYKDDSEDFVAISQKNSIVIYRNEKFSKIELINDSDKPVTTLQRYNNYLFYLYKSAVWALDITNFGTENWQAPSAVNISNPNSPFGILSSNSSFSICEDKIVCFDSDFIYLYQLSTDSFGALKVDEIKKTPQENVTKLLLSKTGKVYFAKSSEVGIFLWDGDVVSTFNSTASTVRMLAESDDGASVYYSCEDGVFSLDSTTAEKSTVKEISTDTTEADLGQLYQPQGICLLGDKLWIVDNMINAVQEIDLTNGNEFTDFAITTNSTAVNRLTAGVRDVTVDKDVIFALDNGRIVAIKNVDSPDRTYSRINLGSSQIDEFSAGNGYICYSNGNTISICKYTPIDDEQIEFELSNHQSVSFDDSNGLVPASDIIDISYSEGYFYVTYTATYDNVNHPCIYKINTNTSEFTVDKVIFEQTQVGSAIEVTADVFGTVYYCTRNSSNYEFYSYDGNKLKLVASKPYSSNILNLQTDFDGKLYALYENNAIDIIEDNKITSKTLETSANLGSINPAKSMCLSCNSQTAYFIFEGLILNSSNVTDLGISTPRTIAVPDGFTTAFNPNQTFAKIKEGAKLFEVDLENTTGDYFAFVDYSDAVGGETDYAVIRLSDKYSLLIKDGVSAVARNSDVVSTRTFDTEAQRKFAVVGFTPYSVPVLESFYKTSATIDKYDVVEIVGKITFNDINYIVVKDGENYGYVPDTFVVDSIISEDGNANVNDVYVFSKGGITVYDKDGNAIGTITKKTKVTILQMGATLTILYGDGVGYISSEYIVSDSRAEILKAIAITLGALSICVTAIYFEKRYLLRRN